MTTKAPLEDLLRHLAPEVLGALARRYRQFDACEDAVQEALLAASVQWPESGVPDNPRGWLITVASRRLTDELRAETARRRREERETRERISDPVDLDREIINLTEAEAVQSALASLPDAERIAIELAYFGGHTYREVALLLEQPEGTVKSRIRAGMLRLRAALVEAGITGT